MDGDKAVVDPVELEKALDNALAGEAIEKETETVEDLEKAKKEKKPEKSDPENDEEKETEEEGGTEAEADKEIEYEEGKKDTKEAKGVKKSDDDLDFEALSKSIPEILEEDEDASKVVDAMPFVKALVDSVDEQIVELTKAVIYLADKLENIEESIAKNNEIDRTQAKLVKSISERIGVIGSEVQPRKAFLGSKITILKKSDGEDDQEIELTKSEAKDGLTELCKSGTMNMNDVTKYESYINNGRELPESVIRLIASTKK